MNVEELKALIVELKHEYLKARVASKRLELLTRIAELERAIWSQKKRKPHSDKPA